MKEKTSSIFQKEILLQAFKGSFARLNPITLLRNPVMLIVEIGAVITTVQTIINIYTGVNYLFNIQITIWLWFTVLFANFAEALAESQGKARAESLKRSRSEALAKIIHDDGSTEEVSALSLEKGDNVLVEEGDIIPSDGDIIEGTALVDESAVTGESAPVVRESGGDKSGVTGGTKLLSGTIKVMITANPGHTFLDNMISMVESAKRQKTPNEKALEILLIALTALFIAVVVTLPAFANYMGISMSIPILIALLVCLMPTTIGALLPAIGIAGMDRLLQHNVVALSGRAVEASGDVSVVLLDKTGTITLGNRMATEFIPAAGVETRDLIQASLMSSLADETPEGRSIVKLAKKELNMRGSNIHPAENTSFVPFTPETRMSGVNIGPTKIRKGSADAIEDFVIANGGTVSENIKIVVDDVSVKGDTPLVVANENGVLGVIR
ncbi:MAG TPA: potassium-transporting ATPase subunit KdpB, partial [Methanobacteriaceae archaeon]|nr:potassium-transporting ATPase subunit KdpB [Methanobacteriaceae archaeon]